jgi:methionyl-tRNA synthetase
MLMSAEIKPAHLVFSHGFITVEGQKMSKTLGNVLDPIALCDSVPADAVRYYMFAKNTFSQDADFADRDMRSTVNAHLANSYGNLMNRVLKLIENNCDGKVPAGTVDPELLKEAVSLQKEYCQFMEDFEFAKALGVVLLIVDSANKHLNDNQPWTMYKEARKENDEAKAARAASVLLTSLELIKRATVLYVPFIPALASRVWDQLGFDKPLEKVALNDELVTNLVPPGQAVRNTGPAFPRLEEPEVSPT